MFFLDAHAVLFTVCILGASSYETRRANDTASILVDVTLALTKMFQQLRKNTVQVSDAVYETSDHGRKDFRQLKL